jgi:hypothetical protein
MENIGSNELTDAAGKEYMNFPRWVRRLIWFIAFLVIIAIAVLKYWPSKTTVSGNQFYSIQGTAILRKNGVYTVLRKHIFNLANASSLQTAASDMNGNFYIENVKLPENKTVLIIKASVNGTEKYRALRDISADVQAGNKHEIELGDVYFDEVTPAGSSPVTKTFGINCPNKKLINLLQQYTGLTYEANSNMHIEIKQTGKIEKVGNGLYYYPGGSLEVQVQATGCHYNMQYPIARTLPAGNDLTYVQDEIQQQINRIISSNTTSIAKKISECFE